MGKNGNPVVAVNVAETVKVIVDAYAQADKAAKNAKAVMEKSREPIIQAAVPTYNENCAAGVKSVNVNGDIATAQVTFKSTFTLKTDKPAFETVKAAAREGKVPCITEEKSICIRQDKAAEVVAFLNTLGRADLIVETTTFNFNRAIFDEMEKNKVYAARAELLDCLEENSIYSIKIV